MVRGARVASARTELSLHNAYCGIASRGELRVVCRGGLKPRHQPGTMSLTSRKGRESETTSGFSR